MEFPKLSKIDKAFLMVLAGILSVGIVIQAGSGFSGVDNTFGVDGTGEGYIEVFDLNVSRDWFRGLVNVTDNILGINLNDLIPDGPDTYDIGSTTHEWKDLYLGTGRVHFWTDQSEYIESNGGALRFGVGGVAELQLGSAFFLPLVDDGNSLGNTNNQWANLYLGEGRIYFFDDQGESIYSNGTHLKIDGSAGILPDGGNNTGAIGADAERWANGWFTTITAKSSVTGNVIETEIGPAPWESFEEGDVVKIYDSEYFVKTSKKLDYVVGVVVENPEMIIDHYDITWELIEEQIPLTEEVEYIMNKTDAYGNNFTVVETRMEEVYEHYLNPVEEMLFNGSKITIYYNESRIVYETVYENVITETPIFVEEGSPVLCVAGVTKVKIIEPVFKNDILVAGPNGIARPFRVVVEEIKANYGGVPFNWNKVLDVIENFNMRTLGQVMENSDGDYCKVMLW